MGNPQGIGEEKSQDDSLQLAQVRLTLGSRRCVFRISGTQRLRVVYHVIDYAERNLTSSV